MRLLNLDFYAKFSNLGLFTKGFWFEGTSFIWSIALKFSCNIVRFEAVQLSALSFALNMFILLLAMHLFLSVYNVLCRLPLFCPWFSYFYYIYKGFHREWMQCSNKFPFQYKWTLSANEMETNRPGKHHEHSLAKLGPRCLTQPQEDNLPSVSVWKKTWHMVDHTTPSEHVLSGERR